MTVYKRWFIVPAVKNNRGNNVPKYIDSSELAYTGDTIPASALKDHYPALKQTYPDVDTWYIVLAYGRDTAGWNALNEVSVKGDTRNLATNLSDVAPVLNARLPGLDRTGDEWAQSFRIDHFA